ncbi:MAG: hypothetical protein LBK18_05800, partial [Prevotellaceae bacterium]|nr:hypothetical protein [Prevotellaceae bacterium]
SPFIGVVLAGEFTESALTQLKSCGFNVLFFHYKEVISAFSKYGIDIAFDEQTAEVDFKSKIDNWANLPNKEDVAKELLAINKTSVDEFLEVLSSAVARFIERITILPLHGKKSVVNNLPEAIDFIEKYAEKAKLPLVKYEIIIKYNTGDKIEASFKEKQDCIRFLETYL